MNNQHACMCRQKDVLVMDGKQVSRVIALSLLGLFFTFVGGYFLGKRKGAYACLHADQEHYFQEPQEEVPEDVQPASTPEQQPPIISHGLGNPSLSTNADNGAAPHADADAEYYKAQLIGFGSEKNAQKFVDRLKKAGIATNIIKRSSKGVTKNGIQKTIFWYQVVTQAEQKARLDDIVSQIQRIEKIHDVKVIKVHNDCNARKNA